MPFNHRKIAAFVLICLFALPAFGQNTKSFTERFTLSNEGRVSVDTYKGTIEVTTWDGDYVQVDAEIEGDGNDDLVAYTEIRMRQSGRTVYLETDYSEAKKKMKRSKIKSYSLPFAHYTIRMPGSAELTIDDYKSDIDVEGVNADIYVDTYKGMIDMRDISGEMYIETYKSEVRIRDLAGSLNAETYKGSFDVEFTEFTGDTSFDTYRGSIDVTLPQGAGFDLDADWGKAVILMPISMCRL